VDGVSFTVEEGESVALVGESACGKSVTALSILQLVPEPAGYIESGRVLFRGEDLLDRTWEQMREVRGRHIGMIFQEPMTSLNAVFTVGQQLVEAMTVHGGSRKVARRRAEDLLERVRLENPAQILRQYPHELSGGMRQRVMIAMALMNHPALLIADEPTTALDVTVQAQILALLAELQREMGMAVLLITHDLGIVAEMADQVAVMYAGEIVENAPAAALYARPRHPYTQGLFASLPSRQQRGRDLVTLEGVVPDPIAWPAGCRFAERCPQRMAACRKVHPRLTCPRLPDRPDRPDPSDRSDAPTPDYAVRCILYPECHPKGDAP
ncbi:MAG: ABC transporter ATP-binding protein, partial [Armatimonadetes bacterium]|nr:ABC transporter ATP-binding protein [Armatimonadota bacterium]